MKFSIVNEIYNINYAILGIILNFLYFVILGLTSLGCWKDDYDRAIDNYEGKLGIAGCFERAKVLGNQFFAVQDGGHCFTTATAGETYQKHGSSEGCSAAGNGGKGCQNVYKIGKLILGNENVFISRQNL